MSEEPTLAQPPAGPEPTRPPPASRAEPGPARPRRGSWVALGLATACGFLLGVLVVTTLGGGDAPTRTETRRVTLTGAVTRPGGTVITKTLVPAMVGQPLDLAKARAARAKFVLAVDSGGGLFGVVREENWEVVAQRPGPDELFEQGSTIHVDIAKR